MKALVTLDGIAAPLPWDNVDTDMILPKQYLKWLTRIGIREGLFAGVRKLPDGTPDSAFVLNQSRYRDAAFLIAGANFGTGSSREHAVWALMDTGIRCVIAPSFGDTFYQNCFKNGLLPLRLPADDVQALQTHAGGTHPLNLHLDVAARQLRLPDGIVFQFELATNLADALVTGRDEIGDTLAHKPEIGVYETGTRVPHEGNPRTLHDKLWDSHVVTDLGDGTSLLYVDRHLIHEVSSPLAFEGMQLAGRWPRRSDLALAVTDHNVPTTSRQRPIDDPDSAAQIAALQRNASEFGIELLDLTDRRQGIVHVVGPEQGFTQPGVVLVCGDSHASTHGAFGALAYGIGTSEIEHVLATQTLRLSKARSMRVEIGGTLPSGLGAKDLALAVIGRLGVNGASGHVIEYCGAAVEALSMEGRMTLCNMSIEAGARAGLVAVDATTIAYLEGRPRSPKGSAWADAVRNWAQLRSDDHAMFDANISIDAANLPPLVTWGTSPEDVVAIDGRVPDPETIDEETRRTSKARALRYMQLTPGQLMSEVAIDRAFIGSCTNGRIEDLRIAASMARGRHVAASVRAMVVPGSGLVKAQAEAEGLDAIFRAAGFEWREAGCSMCVAMNDDTLLPGERCASTSNRNFVDRQGPGGLTHLASPATVAAAAIAGRFVDIRAPEWRR